jgi:starch-binding outer membrane protein, SusD/RagB family
MKTIRYIFFTLGLGLFMLSCSEEFLERPLYNELNKTIFYKTEEDAKAAIIAAYDVLGWYGENVTGAGGVFQGWLYRIDYSAVDLSHPGGTSGPDGNTPTPLYEYTLTPTSGNFLDRLFAGHYVAIQRANTVLANVKDIDMNEQQKQAILAEAKFIRALVYFNLVRMWGDVPYIDFVPTGNSLYTPRTDAGVVYEKIIQDLTEAIPSLPVKWTGLDLGRATEGAARLLLAKVYLTRAGYRLDSKTGEWAKTRDDASSQDWAKALEYAQSVLDMGQYNLWQDADLGSGRLLSTIPGQAKNTDKIRSGYEANFWTENDGDQVNGEAIFEIQFSSYWPGRWSAGTLRQEGSNHNDFDLPTSLNAYGGVVHYGYNHNSPRPKFVASYEPGDKRKDATILTPGDTMWLRQWGEGNETGYFVWSGDVGNYWLNIGSERHIVRKWVWGYTDERESSPVNHIVLRLADAYLIKAEALNEMGRTGEAFEPLNVIRRRAGLADVTGLSREDLRDKIYEERKFEFAYEINRYFDALRSGNLEKWVLADRDVPIQRFHNLMPIPQLARDLDPGLTQNFGY